MHSRSGSLPATAPFDLLKSLRFIDKVMPMSGDQETAEGMLTKAVMADGQTVAIKVSQEKKSETAGVNYELFSETELTDAVAHEVVEQISFYLSLEDDLAPFYAIAAKDLKFRPIAESQVGLHHVKSWSVFEITCWALLSQRSRMPVAKKAKDALTERFGGTIQLEGRTYRAFPDYQTLKNAKVADILAATRNRRNAERISELMYSFEDLDERFLRTAPYEKVEERLKRIKGIGDWSAQFILFRGLGRIKKIQLNMGPAMKVMEEVYGPEMDLDGINRLYGEWCGYWSLYLRGAEMASGKTAAEED